jgi:hypothetical protein
MTAEFQALVKAANDGLLNDAGRKALADEIRRRLLAQLGEKSVEAMDKEVAEQIAKEEARRGGWLWRS